MVDTSLTNPTMVTMLTALKNNIFNDLNCHHIGVIDSFNAENQTVAISMAYKARTTFELLNKQPMNDFPPQFECPVVIYSGGPASLTMPITKGDYCLLFFNDVDIDNWYTAGSDVTLNSRRKHSYSDAIALVGLNPKISSLENYSADRAEFKYNDTMVSLKEKIRIKNQNKNLLTILNSFVSKLSTLSMTITGAVPISGPAGTTPVTFSAPVFTTNGSNWNSAIINFQQEFSDLLET